MDNSFYYNRTRMLQRASESLWIQREIDSMVLSSTDRLMVLDSTVRNKGISKGLYKGSYFKTIDFGALARPFLKDQILIVLDFKGIRFYNSASHFINSCLSLYDIAVGHFIKGCQSLYQAILNHDKTLENTLNFFIPIIPFVFLRMYIIDVDATVSINVGNKPPNIFHNEWLKS